MDNRRDVITARNLLANQTCSNCRFKFECISKLKTSHKTCAKWTREYNEIEKFVRAWPTNATWGVDTPKKGANDTIEVSVRFNYKHFVESVSVEGTIFTEKEKDD